MVAGGSNAIEVTNIVEIVDLETTRSNCPNFPLLPRVGYTAAGTFVDHPMVCGGYFSQSQFDRSLYTTIVTELVKFGQIK